MANDRLNVCFVAHFAYRALAGGSDGHIGGVERQTALMAKWLARRGHDVTVVVWDEGQDDEGMLDGVRVIKVCREAAGIPGLRFFVPRWSSLNRALAAADASVYYHNCAEYVTGQVALWARRKERRFVYSVASDAGCSADLPTLPKRRERVLYRYGLTHADLVICQTRNQQAMLREAFGVSALALPMPCLTSAVAANDVSSRIPKVLWIGRLDRVKRIELIPDVARACPDFEFDVVGPVGEDPRYVEAVQDAAADVANLSWVGPVSFADVGAAFERCAALLCTSVVEGFPNTFLEAWSRGVPIVTTFDPDGLIATHELGCVGRDAGELAALLTRLFADPGALDRMSANAQRYFRDHHDADRATQRFEEALLKVQSG